MCKRVLVTHSGRGPEDSKIEEVFHRPATGHSRSLVCGDPEARRNALGGHDRGGAPRLVVENLSFRYGRKQGPLGRLFGRRSELEPTLDRIDLAIQPRQTLGIVVESGSCKSTCSALIASLLSCNAGTIELHGAALEGSAAGREPTVGR